MGVRGEAGRPAGHDLPGDGTVLVRARSGTDITAAYPELLPLAKTLGRRAAVLDGEIVALDGQGRSDFERLQQRMGLAGVPARAARTAARVPAHLMLFDVVHLDGRPVTGLPYSERRGLLEGLGLAGPAWSTPAAIVGHGAQAGKWSGTLVWKDCSRSGSRPGTSPGCGRRRGSRSVSCVPQMSWSEDGCPGAAG